MLCVNQKTDKQHKHSTPFQLHMLSNCFCFDNNKRYHVEISISKRKKIPDILTRSDIVSSRSTLLHWRRQTLSNTMQNKRRNFPITQTVSYNRARNVRELFFFNSYEIREKVHTNGKENIRKSRLSLMLRRLFSLGNCNKGEFRSIFVGAEHYYMHST